MMASGQDRFHLEARSAWYERIAAEVNQHIYSLGSKGAGKYKLDLLLRIAARVDEFSGYCGECQSLKDRITALVQELGLELQQPSREGRKKYGRQVAEMVSHLKKVHSLVEEGHYKGIGIGIGLAIGGGLGGALGTVLDNPGIGTGIGMVLGLAIGAYLDKRARDEGRII